MRFRQPHFPRNARRALMPVWGEAPVPPSWPLIRDHVRVRFGNPLRRPCDADLRHQF